MRFKVFRLRQGGCRLNWRDVINGPSFVGDLRSHSIDRGGYRYSVLAVHPVEVPIGKALLPELYEPVLVGFAPLAFRVRGFERVETAAGWSAVAQEWHVQLP